MFKPLIFAAALAITPAAFAQDHADHSDHDHAQHDHSEHDHADHANHEQHDHSEHDGEHAAHPSLSHTAEIDAAIAAGGTPIVVEVLGAVCDFCAKAMNKSFGRRDDVAAVYVDLDEKTLNLVLVSDAEMTDEEIRKIVKRSGYKAKNIYRTDILES